MGNIRNGDFPVSRPVTMLERNDKDGKITPLAFYYTNNAGEISRIKVDKVISCIPMADIKCGAVGDRYECMVDGKREYLYYSVLQPRKWYRIEYVTEEEYNAYYKLPER